MGELPKPWKLKWVKHIIYSNFYPNPQAAERFQVPPMGLPGWPGAPPFMPMPGAVFNVENHGLFLRFFRCHAHALGWTKCWLACGRFFLFGRHAYDAAPLGSGFLVKQQPRRRCNGWGWVLLYRPFKAMPPWGMPSMPGMTAVPMEHNGFPFDAEVWRSRRSFLYQVVSK